MTDITDQLRQAAANMNEQGLVGWGKLLNHTIELIERLAQKLRVEGNCNGQLERQIAERDAEIERQAALICDYRRELASVRQLLVRYDI